MGDKIFYRNVDLINSVSKKIILNNLLKKKDRVLLSFSGGQDSICLLFLVNQLYSQMELDLALFWCNHLWQKDSFSQMQQIAKLSFVFQFNSCFAIPSKFILSELLARKWRYGSSYRISIFYNYSKICLAHTSNDKVETIFLNMMRGTGLTGLSPLRLTQFISKNNIEKGEHISQLFTTQNSPLFQFFPILSPNRKDANSFQFSDIKDLLLVESDIEYLLCFLRVDRKATPLLHNPLAVSAKQIEYLYTMYTSKGVCNKGVSTRRNLHTKYAKKQELLRKPQRSCFPLRRKEAQQIEYLLRTNSMVSKFIHRRFAVLPSFAKESNPFIAYLFRDMHGKQQMYRFASFFSRRKDLHERFTYPLLSFVQLLPKDKPYLFRAYPSEVADRGVSYTSPKGICKRNKDKKQIFDVAPLREKKRLVEKTRRIEKKVVDYKKRETIFFFCWKSHNFNNKKILTNLSLFSTKISFSNTLHMKTPYKAIFKGLA